MAYSKITTLEGIKWLLLLMDALVVYDPVADNVFMNGDDRLASSLNTLFVMFVVDASDED